MATRGMRHAGLWVTDPAASARFYEQALVLEIKTMDLEADIAAWGADRLSRGA